MFAAVNSIAYMGGRLSCETHASKEHSWFAASSLVSVGVQSLFVVVSHGVITNRLC